MRVHIFKPNNWGKSVGVTEKRIYNKKHIILINLQTGKIVLMVSDYSYADVRKLLLSHEDACSVVETLTCGISQSNTYSKLCGSIFFNANLIIDKFSVIQKLLTHCQRVRISLQQQIYKTENIQYNSQDVMYIKRKFNADQKKTEVERVLFSF